MTDVRHTCSCQHAIRLHLILTTVCVLLIAIIAYLWLHQAQTPPILVPRAL